MPEGWAELDIQRPNPTSNVDFEVYALKEGGVSLTATRQALVAKTTRDAEETVRGTLDSMILKGFEVTSTSSTMVQGLEARHLQGTLPNPEEDGRIVVDTYLVFTSTSLAGATISQHPDAVVPGRAESLLSHLKIPGSPVSLYPAPPSDITQTANYKVG